MRVNEQGQTSTITTGAPNNGNTSTLDQVNSLDAQLLQQIPPAEIGPSPPVGNDHDFGPFDDPMELLNTYVRQLAQPEAQETPFILITDEQLFNALKAVTGVDAAPGDSRRAAVKEFFDHIVKTNQENSKWEGGSADVNGDGITDANDLIQVYKMGHFDLDENISPPNPPMH